MYQGRIEACTGQLAPEHRKRSTDRGLAGKRAFDIVFASVGLILIAPLALLLLIINPIANPGPLFFLQDRMGKDGQRFTMWKFRTMRVCTNGLSARPALTALETDRITPFARMLRKFRIDELPNFINVLGGDMSVIGPRPDAWDHAIFFEKTVPYYKDRFDIKPGITGLAQVQGGYAECSDATRRKARFDRHYIRRQSWKMELFIFWRTLVVVTTGFGAK